MIKVHSRASFPFLILKNEEEVLGLIPMKKGDITSIVEDAIAQTMDGEHAHVDFGENAEILDEAFTFKGRVKFTENEEADKYSFSLTPVHVIEND